MWTQCVHKNPTTIVPIAPKSNPAFLKANGMAKIPDPRELFNKWANDPMVEFPFGSR